MAAAAPLGPLSSGLHSPLSSRRVAFTTPLTYAGWLARLLNLCGAVLLHLPIVVIDHTLLTVDALRPYLTAGALEPFVTVAFTFHTTIVAFSLTTPLTPAGLPASSTSLAPPRSTSLLSLLTLPLSSSTPRPLPCCRSP